MVRLVELDDGDEVPPLHPPHYGFRGGDGGELVLADANGDRPNLNLELVSAKALGCYPIASQLSHYLDLNTLHDLSRTCRQIRANLLQHRRLLIKQTLRCANETANPALRLGGALNASFQQWMTYARTGTKNDRISGGKVGACARDMVGECRRCADVVCRNCVMKPPPTSALKGRVRRLCRACMKCPLDRLTVVSTYVSREEFVNETDATIPDHLYYRSPCTCVSAGLWICQPCGQQLRSNDTTYLRGWTWRNHYAACGGMGAGLGEGNEGVECGRGAACGAASLVEREIESDDILDPEEFVVWESDPRHQHRAGPGYTTHEIVGIGGVVKKKVTEVVRVGAGVKEYEDEKAGGGRKLLLREQEGVNRCWCSWCERVVLGKKDVEGKARSTESLDSASSGVSAV